MSKSNIQKKISGSNIKNRVTIDEGLVYRIIDANRNRLKEGLRVCEDITRYILNDIRLTRAFRDLRHMITDILDKSSFDLGRKLLKYRNVMQDVGREMNVVGMKKNRIIEIFDTNLQRSKEAVRVLEEFSKLFSRAISRNFEKIRFKLYELEKKVHERF